MTAAPTPGPCSLSLPSRRAVGPGAHSVCQRLTVTAAPTPYQHSLSASLARRPQSRPRANCDGCAYPLTVAHCRRAAGQGAHSVGKGLTVTAAPTPDQHTVTRAASAPRRQFEADAKPSLSRPGHARLWRTRSFSKQPNPMPPRAAVPNRRGF